MSINPFLNELSALQQIDTDLAGWSTLIIANLQANAALMTSGVMRTTVDFLDVPLSTLVRNVIPALAQTHPAMAGASAVVLAANGTRRYFRIKNNTATPVFLRFAAAAAVVTNYPLNQNEVFEMISPNVYAGEIRGITGGGATTLDVIEG